MCSWLSRIKLAFLFSLLFILSGSIASVATSECHSEETAIKNLSTYSILDLNNQDIDWELTPLNLLKPVMSKKLSDRIITIRRTGRNLSRWR